MHIGPRHDRHCEKITTTDGHKVDEVRYLGIFIVRSIPNSNVLLTTQNAHFSALKMVFLPKLADWLQKRLF